MTVNEFVAEISSISLPNVFNPYRDICDVADHANSAAIRRRNLGAFLEAVQNERVRSIWLGRDLGYRGGRRTGIALTDEFHLDTLVATYGLVGVCKATLGTEVRKERTATEVWKLLTNIRKPIFLWNVFPFHPFDKNKPFTNRRHTSREFDVCRDILVELVRWLNPTMIVALGADAECAVLRLGLQCRRVRHPSYGGQVTFAREIRRMYVVAT
jgi:Uracil DNA glycosylase superfamily